MKILNFLSNSAVLTLFTLCTALSCGASLAADPTPATPFEPLAAHGIAPEGKQLWSQLAAHDESIRQLIEKIYKSKTSPKERDYCQLYVQVEQYRRWIEWLSVYREPAAVDFRFRSSVYGQKLGEVATRYWGSPPAGPAQQKVLQQLNRSNNQRIKQLEKILKTLQSGNPKQAEDQFFKLYDDIFSNAAVLTPKQKERLNAQLDQASAPIIDAMWDARRAAAKKILDADEAKFTNYYQSLIQKVTQAKDSIDDGPSMAEAFCKEWRNAHRGMVRIAAMRNRDPNANDWASRFRAALGAFVASDVASANADSAKEKYERYTSLLADLSLRMNQPEWFRKMAQTLMPLAAKAGIGRDVLAYEAATSDLLRWRERAAAAKATAIAETIQSPADLARPVLVRSAQLKGGIYTDEDNLLPKLQAAIPETVPTVSDKLVGKSVFVEDAIRLDTESTVWMSRIKDNFYSKVDLSSFIQSPAVAELAKDLVANSEAPLTIDAQAALSSAKQGYYVKAGGTIESFAAEGALARLAALPSVASNLVELGTTLPPIEKIRPDSALILRLEIKPTWVHHRYFFLGP